MKEVLSGNNIRYGYVDITSGMAHLQKYLRLRDKAESHAEARNNGTIGIPTLVVDKESYMVKDADMAKQLVEELHLAE